MADKKSRRTFTADEKAAILRRHLRDKVAVSDLCDEYKVQPSVFYGWLRQLMDNMSQVLGNGGRRRVTAAAESKADREVQALKEKLAKKDSVIAEISEEYVSLKKTLGDA